MRGRRWRRRGDGWQRLAADGGGARSRGGFLAQFAFITTDAPGAATTDISAETDRLIQIAKAKPDAIYEPDEASTLPARPMRQLVEEVAAELDPETADILRRRAGLEVAGASSATVTSDSAVALERIEASNRAVDWSENALTVAQYCSDQTIDDGTGNVRAAYNAAADLIDIARRFPDEAYQGATMYRQALGDVASTAAVCDQQLADRIDRALSTLP
jgi:hypothetical protein